jgi:hypothetical protein
MAHGGTYVAPGVPHTHIQQFSNSHTPTPSKDIPTGMSVIHAVLMSPKGTKVCHARHIYVKQAMTFTSLARMLNSTLIWDIPVLLRTDTKHCFHQTCDG